MPPDPCFQLRRPSDPVYGAVWVKEGRPEETPARVRPMLAAERRMLELLRDMPGCPRLVGDLANPDQLIMADTGGVPLDASGLPGRLDIGQFLHIAEALADTVAGLHARQVIHRHIRPENILIRLDDLAPQLINFDAATRFMEEEPAFNEMRLPMEPCPYASPEQTGLMYRPIDYRTDLYSLGAMLYYLATGVPPFQERDMLALVHAQLAREPRPPQELAGWLPEAVSRALLILLAKEPDQRYQSAAGLRRDLDALCEALASRTPLSSVELRAHDLPLLPHKPTRLQGRETELSVLRRAFDGTRLGGSRALFIGGYPGVGKTFLIQELRRYLLEKEGWFIAGKFQQFQLDQPFLAPIQALGQLCQLLLVEPEERRKSWKARLLHALGPDASVLFELIPELRDLLGPQAVAPALDPVRGMLRLRGLLTMLIQVAASRDQPLVMFFDDLQWADQASLDFLGALEREASLDGLLLLGAFRNQEVDGAHPLYPLLGIPAVDGMPPRCLLLEDLPEADIRGLLADMLRAPAEDLAPLAELVIAKTGGNPYFTIEFVRGLYRQGLLRPDPARGSWIWDSQRIAAHDVSGNVVEFLARDLSSDPRLTSDAIVAAACLGDTCTLGCLSLATGMGMVELTAQLTPALERGILVSSSLVSFQRSEPQAPLRFCHDRMRQAVHQSRNDDWIRRLHLDMARRFCLAGPTFDAELRAAEHFAQASSLILDSAERARVQGLFMKAARHARQSGAFATAERYVRLAVDLCAAVDSPPALASAGPPVGADPERVYEVYSELHLLLYSQSRHAEADRLYEILEILAATPQQWAEAATIQVMSLSNRTLYEQAIELTVRFLGTLGISVPLEDPLPGAQREMDLLYQQLAGVEGADLLPRRPALPDDCRAAAARLMNRAIPAAFFCNPLIAFWLVAHIVRLWLKEGYRDLYLYPASCLTLACIALRDDYRTGYRLAREAREMAMNFERGAETARAEHVYGLLNAHWFQPLENDLGSARMAFEGLMRGGELEFACFTYFTRLATLLDTGDNLETLEAEVAVALGFARQYGNRHAEESFLTFRQLVRALQGLTTAPGSFSDADFDEREHLASIRGNPMALAFFHTYRALAAALFATDDTLRQHAETALSLRSYITGFYPTALIHTLHALACLRRLAHADAVERPVLMSALDQDLRWLTARAADAPMNFAHLRDWLEAERRDAEGRSLEALDGFERAMRGVRLTQRSWHHALIVESAGRCYLRHGLDQAGQSLLASARDRYQDWGALGKVSAMREEWSFLGPSPAPRPGSVTALDYQALLRASQALAAERSLSALVDRVVELMAQLTGATDVRLLALDEAGDWYLEGGMRGQERLERMPIDAARECHLISGLGLRLAMNTARPILSEDAVADGRFDGDPHFEGLPLCSLLGLPISLQGRLSAFLVLENRLLRAAFTTEHVETLSVLCSQLAVSIENIRVYQALERKVAERTQQLAAASQAKSEFLANMSHEIRTPMNAILGLTQILERDTLTPDQHDLLRKIGEAGQGLLQIINDILDFSKIEAGQLTIDPHPFDLTQVLSQVETLLSASAEHRGLAWGVHIPGDLAGSWQGDALRIRQILVNFASNAIKFTERGKVELRVSAVTKTAASARLRFEVSDTGIGITPETLARLFQPFTQADASTTRRFGGTGLGLSICKRLVELMDGAIGANSTPGQGSTFWCELPLERALEPVARPETSVAPDGHVHGPRLSGMRVLAVDDNRINLLVLERALELEDAHVSLAADGRQALEILRTHPAGFDIVLMDVQMPVMDGLTATRAIRADPALARLPVIALTAGVLAEERAAAQAAGVNDFLAKPLNLEALVGMLQALRPQASIDSGAKV